jgi:peroxiredoxin
MTTKKTPTMKNQPTKAQQTARHANHQGASAGSSSRNPANHSHTSAKAASTAARVSQHAEKHQHGQPATTTHAHQRRRRQTFAQRLAHLSTGNWFLILTSALVIGIIVFAIIASRSNTPSSTASNSPTGLLAVGTQAPAIASLPAADGKSYSLAQFKGKVVVLEFYAPWCPHCQDETATLKQFQQNYGSKGAQVLSVSASPYGRNYESGDLTPISMSDIQWFSSNFGLNYPALFDQSLKAGTAYGIQAFPTIYILNKQGVITYATSGEMSYASLQQQVDAALSQ